MISEIYMLIELLKSNNIPFETQQLFGTTQVIYPSKQDKVCDAVCHEYSYGYEKGLLEMMGLCNTEDCVEGYLTAEEVFRRIKNHYLELNKQFEGKV